MGFHHSPDLSDAAGPPSVAAAEALLSDWFQAPVVLTSSGRGAMLLFFEHLGLNRYRDRIATPTRVSACVLDAIIRRGFPVDAAQVHNAEAVVFYHQYGLSQRGGPRGARVLEDLCHGFFATPETGSRRWCGQGAVFSLPKFFGTRTMIGGLVVPDEATARALRERRDRQAPGSAAVQARHADDFRTGQGAALEVVYLERLLNPAVAASELAGMPSSLDDIREAGARRASVLGHFLSRLPAAFAVPTRRLVQQDMPYALPVLQPAGFDAQAARGIFEARGFPGDSYGIDVARDLHAPEMQPAWLLPCHQDLPFEAIDALCADLARLPLPAC